MKIFFLLFIFLNLNLEAQVIDIQKYQHGTFFSTTWDTVGLKFGYAPADGAHYSDGTSVPSNRTASYGDHINIAFKQSPVLSSLMVFKPGQGPIYGGGFTLFSNHIEVKFRSRSINGSLTPGIKNKKIQFEFAQVMADLTNLPAKLPDGTMIKPTRKFTNMGEFRKVKKYERAIKNPIGQMVDCVMKGLSK